MEKPEGGKQAVLFLEDGSFFLGKGFGAEVNITGEVVFNTGMVGYPESMTDPSYAGQILCFTYPLIGNYGVPSMRDRDLFGLPVNFESEAIKVSGIIVQEACETPHHWGSKTTLSEWMMNEGIPGIADMDTRALVTTIRERGVMMGVLANGVDLPGKREMKEMLNNASRYDTINFVKAVSCREPVRYGTAERTVALLDCGVKLSIIRNLLRRGYSVVRVPYDSSYAQVTSHNPEGVVISNGPGDPTLCHDTIKTVSRLVDSEVPLLGICLGEQLVGLSQGASTYKLKYGHRGQNKPVVDLLTRRGYVTSQNHGYAVQPESLKKTAVKAWFVNADDGSIEGIVHENKPCLAVQFHPEASPGPYDTGFVFDKFKAMTERYSRSIVGERIRSVKG
jgi:carbamoyl-phosphate synthase small subunit